jgi:pyruvate/2-oxoglutarate/acetoin dehydrogenase E1 component
MSSNNRILKYSLAINEALHQTMDADNSVLLIGQGVKSPWYVGNTCNGLLEKFGSERVIDTPVSENAMTGAAIGAALAGMKSITVHPRMDFMLYAFDPLINQAANWSYMNGGRLGVPVVIWGIINRGGEQAAQHSQALHGLFSHIPGFKVVLPATPTDAKGLLIAAINDPNPVIYIDDRWLYNQEEAVPEEPYEIPIGKAAIRRAGRDITIISASYMLIESLKAAQRLEKESIDAEIIDLRSLKPLDERTILKSVQKTGRAIVVDGGWKSFGVSGEIAALIGEKAFTRLKSPVKRVALPDIPAPANSVLESVFYRNYEHIVTAARELI